MPDTNRFCGGSGIIFAIIVMLMLTSIARAAGTNTWTRYQDDPGNYQMGWTTAHWVPVLGKVLLFAGNSHNPLGNNSVRLFDPANNTWDVIYANNNGAAGLPNRDNHVSFYVPNRGINGELWVFKGDGTEKIGVFSLDTNQWTKIANNPATLGAGFIKNLGNYYFNQDAAHCWFPVLNMGVFFSGSDSQETSIIEPNDTGSTEPYKYHHQVYPNSPKGRRQTQNLGTCAGADFYVYAGQGQFWVGNVPEVRSLNDLWKFNMQSRTWTRLADNNLPSATRVQGGYGVMTYDSLNNVLVVSSGNKINVYHINSDVWENRTPPIDTSVTWRGDNHAGVYVPTINQHIYRWRQGPVEGYTYLSTTDAGNIGAPSTPASLQIQVTQ